MHRIVTRALIACAALASAAQLAVAQDAIAVGNKGDVELTSQVRFGGVLLEPGHYQFQHHLADGQHYLVVRGRRTILSTDPNRHHGGAAGPEIARLPCRLVTTPTGKKTWETALYLKKEGDGSRSVTRIDIRGEREGHVVSLEPQS